MFKKSVLSQMVFFVTTITVFLSAKSVIAGPTEIRLQTHDGSAILIGDLVDFSNGIFTIRTDLGDIRISKDQVTCNGYACPDVSGLLNVDA